MYETYEKLPMFRNYKEAWDFLTSTVPIRGRSEETIPLGLRRQADEFSIGTPKDQAREYGVPIELRISKRTCVTFTLAEPGKDTTHATIVGPWGYWSAGTVKFVYSTIRGVRDAFTRKGVLVLDRFGDGLPHITVSRGESVKLCVWDEGVQKCEVVEGRKTLTTIRLNREATNNVRKRYGKFYRYMKGMIKLRTVDEETHYYGVRKAITISADEVKDAVGDGGVVPSTRHISHYPNSQSAFLTFTDSVVSLTRKPAMQTTRWVRSAKDDIGHDQITDSYEWDRWVTASRAFIDLITEVEDEKQMALNFSRAFTLLAVEPMIVDRMSFSVDGVSVKPERISDMADEVVFKVFSNEVFETVEMEAGKVPSFKYEKWITRAK